MTDSKSFKYESCLFFISGLRKIFQQQRNIWSLEIEETGVEVELIAEFWSLLNYDSLNMITEKNSNLVLGNVKKNEKWIK